jgi:hypothetical protein
VRPVLAAALATLLALAVASAGRPARSDARAELRSHLSQALAFENAARRGGASAKAFRSNLTKSQRILNNTRFEIAPVEMVDSEKHMLETLIDEALTYDARAAQLRSLDLLGQALASTSAAVQLLDHGAAAALRAVIGRAVVEERAALPKSKTRKAHLVNSQTLLGLTIRLLGQSELSVAGAAAASLDQAVQDDKQTVRSNSTVPLREAIALKQQVLATLP